MHYQSPFTLNAFKLESFSHETTCLLATVIILWVYAWLWRLCMRRDWRAGHQFGLVMRQIGRFRSLVGLEQVLWKTSMTFETGLLFMLYVDYGFNNIYIYKHKQLQHRHQVIANKYFVHHLNLVKWDNWKNYIYSTETMRNKVNVLFTSLIVLLITRKQY